jgi:hypothetical protein
LSPNKIIYHEENEREREKKREREREKPGRLPPNNLLSMRHYYLFLSCAKLKEVPLWKYLYFAQSGIQV